MHSYCVILLLLPMYCGFSTGMTMNDITISVLVPGLCFLGISHMKPSFIQLSLALSRLGTILILFSNLTWSVIKFQSFKLFLKFNTFDS